jgi:hypothetical protein
MFKIIFEDDEIYFKTLKLIYFREAFILFNYNI